MWWINPEDVINSDSEVETNKPDWIQKFCTHDWKPTTLIVSVVYDCSKCGIKKESFDKWEGGEWK